MELVSEHTGTEKIVEMIRQELSNIAHQDNKVSEDEQALMDKIMSEVMKYKNLLDKAIMDNKLDEQERIRLFSAKLEIIKKAVGQMKKDMIVSKEEQALLNGLQRLLPKISDFESKFGS